MKKTILMVAVAATVMLSSCKQNYEKTESATTETTEQAVEPKEEASIVGVWKMTAFDIDMEIPKGQEKAIEEMKKKMIDATVYTFKEDGKMSLTNHLVKEATGTYTYADGKLITYSDKTKKTDTLAVDELTTDKLVFTAKQGDKKATMTFAK
ncbi:lipocalin family protein [Flavobacterium sp.]|uniref:lipocalin family protein n=1 Tax=Flavobacterium sp. TaxID=239 RepID=UPI0039E42B38